ncbi:DUF1501 domain-containing protein [Candidatus Kapabacteria bacterium]|nr:DUF1501 domain-containing protein [Candidatus Kapabacteria bacterium]
MERRKFLKNTAIAGSALMAAPYISKGKELIKFAPNGKLGLPDDDNIMIIVELFGGNDGLNTVIPVNDSEYYNLRPNIAIRGEDAIQWGDSNLYLHPALVSNIDNNGMIGMLDSGQLSIVEGVGYQNPNLSHFRSRDIWHSGIISNDPNEKLLEGWIGRYLSSKLDNFPFEIPEHPIAISTTGTMPLLMKSNIGHMGITLQNPSQQSLLSQNIKPIFPLAQGNSFFEQEYNFVHVIASQAAEYSKVISEAYDKGTNAIEYSNGRIAQSFSEISKLISGGLKTKIFYLGLSSFDSHVQQRNPDDPLDGQHPDLLNVLSSGISEFMRDMSAQGHAERIVGLTISEFGRRAYDNGSRGSDHGAGSMMFVFGHNDNLRGGRFGNPPNLSDLENSNLRSRPEEDFRRVYADFLAYWLGATQDEIDNLFGEAVDPIDVLIPRQASVKEYIVGGKEDGLKISPNPCNGTGVIEFTLIQRSKVELIIYSLDGKTNLKLINDRLNPGKYTSNFILNKSGQFTATAIINGRRYSKNLIVLK